MTRPSSALIVASIVSLLLVYRPALAHDQQFEITGQSVKIDTRNDPSRHKFSFKSVKELNIFPAHDPAVSGSALLVRWTGQGGSGEGRTPLVALDPNSWQSVNGGYKYSDKTLGSAGVKTILYKATASGGQLKIKAKGTNWPGDSMGGPHDSVWVHLQVEDEWYCAELGGDIKRNEHGRFQAKGAPRPSGCPEQLCGNGVLEIGEDCDDGNVIDNDSCHNDCTVGECSGAVYDSTFEAIQAVIFNSSVYGCNSIACHGAAPGQGLLDLRDGNSFAQLVAVDSSISPGVERVKPGEPALSVLYDKLLAGFDAGAPAFGGSAMPVSATPLTAEHLEAVEKWIRGGAPEDLVVEGTAELLATCLPDPDPLIVVPPDPPGAGVGAQFRQTPWPLAAQGENEICMSTYYDLTQTNLVPESAKVSCSLGLANNPSGECFLWHKQELTQDSQSHHSIIHLYTGAYGTSHNGWGSWTYKYQDDSNPQHGQSCAPTSVDAATGYNPDCSGAVTTSIACIGYGPPDSSVLGTNGFSGSQEPYYEQEFADGVYSLMPMAGIIIWNSHAFNATSTDSTMSQYLSLDFAGVDDQDVQVRQIFDVDDIFITDVPAYETEEYCANFVIPNNSNLFQLSSHTHRFGVHFRIWEPPNSSCSSGSCQPGSPSQLVYNSTDYSDPEQVVFDPPVHYSGNTNNRRFRFCSLYDNGSAPGSPPIKQASNPVGSGCSVGSRQCLGGATPGADCNGNDSVCDSFPGAGDGVCDACPVTGGFTTEDEMFIMLGLYYPD